MQLINSFTCLSPTDKKVIIDFTNIDSWDRNTININHIAKVLSGQQRFNGTIDADYSVAMHSVLVKELVPDDPVTQYAALMHDIEECVTGDIPAPYKQYLYRTVPELKELHTTIKNKLKEIYEVPDDLVTNTVVKSADIEAYLLESAVFADTAYLKKDPWYLNLKHDRKLADMRKDFWRIMEEANPYYSISRDSAYSLFLQTYNDLVKKLKKPHLAVRL